MKSSEHFTAKQVQVSGHESGHPRKPNVAQSRSEWVISVSARACWWWRSRESHYTATALAFRLDWTGSTLPSRVPRKQLLTRPDSTGTWQSAGSAAGRTTGICEPGSASWPRLRRSNTYTRTNRPVFVPRLHTTFTYLATSIRAYTRIWKLQRCVFQRYRWIALTTKLPWFCSSALDSYLRWIAAAWAI